MTREEIERIFEETGVLQAGHFLLTSGRHSDKYMQCARIQHYPKYMAALAAELAPKLPEADVVLAPAVGAVIAGYEVARTLGIRNIFAERESGVMSLRRGFEIRPGERVIVVEDAVTTGGTVREMIGLAQACGAEIVAVAALVDRSGGTVDFGVPFAAAYSADVKSYEAGECPICAEGKLPLISHGSRKLR